MLSVVWVNENRRHGYTLKTLYLTLYLKDLIPYLIPYLIPQRTEDTAIP